MIRLFREQVQSVVTMLAFLKYKAGVETNDIVGAFRRDGYGDLKGNLLNQVHSSVVIGGLEAVGTTLDDLVQVINADQTNQGSGDTGLIDEIVRILQLPRVRNVITSEQLKAMRRALLLPDEMQGLVERLRRSEYGCVSCSRNLPNGEMATMHNGEVVCTNCMSPTSITCTVCRNSVPTPLVVTKKIDTCQCPAHKAGVKNPPGTVDTAVTFNDLPFQGAAAVEPLPFPTDLGPAAVTNQTVAPADPAFARLFGGTGRAGRAGQGRTTRAAVTNLVEQATRAAEARIFELGAQLNQPQAAVTADEVLDALAFDATDTEGLED